MDNSFNYDEAFSRNQGWVTKEEQKFLKSRRVAIAGLGGVGGSHLTTLCRLGIGKFNIADLDIFEQANFNRQAGASLATLGLAKVEAMQQIALGINPDLEIKAFPQGVTSENVDEFLDGVDLYIDGLDFFVLDIRCKVFAACAEKGIPAITAAPLGMGTALLCFLPGKMSFEEYFRLDGQPQHEKILRFFMGLAPARLQMGYLVDPTTLDLAGEKGPSTNMGCDLAAGVAASNALKILLARGKVVCAPYGLHFDAYHNRLRKTWLPMGNNNPLQKIRLHAMRKHLGIL